MIQAFWLCALKFEEKHSEPDGRYPNHRRHSVQLDRSAVKTRLVLLLVKRVSCLRPCWPSHTVPVNQSEVASLVGCDPAFMIFIIYNPCFAPSTYSYRLYQKKPSLIQPELADIHGSVRQNYLRRVALLVASVDDKILPFPLLRTSPEVIWLATLVR